MEGRVQLTSNARHGAQYGTRRLALWEDGEWVRDSAAGERVRTPRAGEAEGVQATDDRRAKSDSARQGPASVRSAPATSSALQLTLHCIQARRERAEGLSAEPSVFADVPTTRRRQAGSTTGGDIDHGDCKAWTFAGKRPSECGEWDA